MNWVIGNKTAFLDKLSQDIYRGLEPVEENYSMELLYSRLGELQQEMKSLVKWGMKSGVVNEKEHSVLGAEIKSIQNRMAKLKDQLTERAMREKRVEELRDYLMTQESRIDKFDDVLFRRLIEKVTVQSMAEVAFLFKVGVEVREVL
jgi:uncharacterized coiled-coil protein SlyX